MNTATAMVQALRAGGVHAVFGIPGAHNLPLYDALYQAGDLPSYVVRHEQGAGYLADGFARASGEVGVILTTTGPGVTNALTPFAGSSTDSTPVLLITTAGEHGLLQQGRGWLHELLGQSALLEAVGPTELIHDPHRAPMAIAQALAALRTGRARPRSIEVPIDLLAVEIGEPEFPGVVVPTPPSPEPRGIEQAARLLMSAVRPVIFAGGGVIRAGASPWLQELAERLGAPVFTSVNGKGAYPEDGPWAAGCPWRLSSARSESYSAIWRQADVGLAVGTRLTGMSTGRWQAPLGRRLIHLDIDWTVFGRSYPTELALWADASLGLQALLATMNRRSVSSQWTPQEIQAARQEAEERGRATNRDAIALMRALREALPDDGVLVCDQAIACYWAVRHYPACQPRTFVYPTGFGNLGYAVPTALGVQVARPDAAVVALCGDGGFLFTATELATARQYHLPIVTVVVNDNAYGMIARLQDRLYEGRRIDVDLVNPDFVALGRAYGLVAERVERLENLAERLKAALAAREPTLIELPLALAPPTH